MAWLTWFVIFSFKASPAISCTPWISSMSKHSLPTPWPISIAISLTCSMNAALVSTTLLINFWAPSLRLFPNSWAPPLKIDQPWEIPAETIDIPTLIAFEIAQSPQENLPEMAELIAVITSEIPDWRSCAVTRPQVATVATEAAIICATPIKATAQIESHGFGSISSMVKKSVRPFSCTSARAFSWRSWGESCSKRASTTWVASLTWFPLPFLAFCAVVITPMAASMCLSCWKRMSKWCCKCCAVCSLGGCTKLRMLWKVSWLSWYCLTSSLASSSSFLAAPWSCLFSSGASSTMALL